MQALVIGSIRVVTLGFCGSGGAPGGVCCDKDKLLKSASSGRQ